MIWNCTCSIGRSNTFPLVWLKRKPSLNILSKSLANQMRISGKRSKPLRRKIWVSISILMSMPSQHRIETALLLKFAHQATSSFQTTLTHPFKILANLDSTHRCGLIKGQDRRESKLSKSSKKVVLRIWIAALRGSKSFSIPRCGRKMTQKMRLRRANPFGNIRKVALRHTNTSEIVTWENQWPGRVNKDETSI